MAERYISNHVIQAFERYSMILLCNGYVIVPKKGYNSSRSTNCVSGGLLELSWWSVGLQYETTRDLNPGDTDCFLIQNILYCYISNMILNIYDDCRDNLCQFIFLHFYHLCVEGRGDLISCLFFTIPSYQCMVSVAFITMLICCI